MEAKIPETHSTKKVFSFENIQPIGQFLKMKKKTLRRFVYWHLSVQSLDYYIINY